MQLDSLPGADRAALETSITARLAHLTATVASLHRKVLSGIQLSTELGRRSQVRQCLDAINLLAPTVPMTLRQLMGMPHCSKDQACSKSFETNFFQLTHEQITWNYWCPMLWQRWESMLPRMLCVPLSCNIMLQTAVMAVSMVVCCCYIPLSCNIMFQMAVMAVSMVMCCGYIPLSCNIMFQMAVMAVSMVVCCGCDLSGVARCTISLLCWPQWKTSNRGSHKVHCLRHNLLYRLA